MALLARAKVRFSVLVFAVLSATQVASAAGSELTEAEIADLQAGKMVVRPDDVDRGGRHFIGGVSYVMINAPIEQVMAVLDDVHTYREILPRTRALRWIGMGREGDTIIELEQGTAVAHGKYVVRVRRDRRADSSSGLVRFWIDRRYPHDIDDANGFFQLETVGDKTRLTYLIMVDLGGSFWVNLFEGRIRNAALSTPMLVKKYVESHAPTPPT